MERMKLKPFQKRDVKRVLAEPSRGAIIASVCGVGKTVEGVEVMARSGARRILILAPINTEDGWAATILAQTGEKMRRVGNETTPQWFANRNIKMKQKPEAGREWYFSGWEFAATHHLETLKWKIDGIIRDEDHREANKDSRSHLAARRLSRTVQKAGGYRLGMSATPAGNKPEGLWALAHSTWPDRDEFKAFRPWVARHMRTEQVKIGWDGHQEKFAEKITGELKPGSIVKELPFYVRHESRTRCCKFHPNGVKADLPERVIHRVGVDLTATQRKIYDKLQEEMFSWIEDEDWPIDTKGYPMVMTTRLHQVCLAVPSTDLAKRLMTNKQTGEREFEDYVKVSYPGSARSSKIDALMDILADIPEDENVLIGTHSQAIIHVIVDRINKRWNRLKKNEPPMAWAWDGTVDKAGRDSIKLHFMERDIRIIVCQIDSMAEGVDGLQEVCHNEIMFSKSNNMIKNVQFLGRLERTGQSGSTINSWQIYARGTIEEKEYETLALAADVMDQTLTVQKKKKKGKKDAKNKKR